MTRLFVDIETRSRVDLKKTGVYKYARCPDFRILMAAWAIDDDPIQIALSTSEIEAIPGLLDPTVTKVAHNAQFERVCFSRFLTMPDGSYLPPIEWHDTQALAGELGWPQSLEMLGKALGGEEKDSAGTRLINLFCKPNRKGEWNGPDTHPLEWMDFIAYCEQDVETLRDIAKRLDSDGGWPTEMEHRVFLADQAINDRGIRIDSDLARKAVEAAGENLAEHKARITELSGMENPNSVQQMGAWLKAEGIKAPNLRAETVEKLLSGDLTAEQREVLELRQELALAAPKKFESALEAALPDDRLRGTLKFFGAHTGRWAGRGTQVQNLPRAAFKTEAETEAAILDLVHLNAGASSESLKKLVRALFTGPFTVVDYASIEARVLAWLAGEEWALQAFRDGRDIYVETAERMSTPGHELDRSQGKVAVLALGYNGGTNSLRAMGADGDEEALKRLVVQWRKANQSITRLWAKLGDAFGELGRVGDHLEITESHDNLGRSLQLWLPSGRAISYHGVKWERYKQLDSLGRMVSKEGWRYADPKNPFNPKQRIGTYGGRLAENATQAVARDIMAEALVRLEDKGYRVVAHVHDEIIVEGEHDVEEIANIMTESPSWAYGLPIDGEGFVCQRYRK